jgi:hypothetical protein
MLTLQQQQLEAELAASLRREFAVLAGVHWRVVLSRRVWRRWSRCQASSSCFLLPSNVGDIDGFRLLTPPPPPHQRNRAAAGAAARCRIRLALVIQAQVRTAFQFPSSTPKPHSLILP